MGAIARYVMQGPRQALWVAVITAAIPLLYWVSAAVVSLVLLRHGLTKTLNILLAVLIPCIVWIVWQQEMMQLLVVGGATLMALVLRLTSSLQYALITSLLPGIAVVILVPLIAPGWQAFLQEVAAQFLQTLEEGSELRTLLADKMFFVMLGGAAVMVQLFACGAFLMARHWQSVLYYPGGFKAEFLSLQMPKWYAVLALLAVLLEASNNTLLALGPVVVIPLFVAGIALVHRAVQDKKLSDQWLLAFYISLLFFFFYMYALLILVAVLDSLVGLRRWLEDKANP